MTLRILRNDSLEGRGVREDFVLLNLCFLPNDTRGFGKSCIFVAEFSRLGLLIICFCWTQIKKGWLTRRGQANLSFVYDDLKTCFLCFK